MQRKLLFLACVISLGIVFQSCIKELDTGNLPVEHKLVIYCMLTPDSLVSVRLGKTSSVLVNEPDSVADATVELYENGKFLETLTPKGQGWFNSAKTYPLVANIYSIKASAPGFETAEGLDSIPMKVTVEESVKKSWTITVNDVQQELVDFTSYFSPSPKPVNYYELMFFTQTSQALQANSPAKYLIHFIAGSVLEADPCIANENYLNSNFSTFLFTDASLDRQKGYVHIKMMEEFGEMDYYATALGYPYDLAETETDYTVLRSVSSAYYLFRKSYYMYISNQQLFEKWDPSDPLSVLINTTPTDIYTNVKNGYGIVAAYQHSYVRTQLFK